MARYAKDKRLSRRTRVGLPASARVQGWIKKKQTLVGRTVDLGLSGLKLRLEGRAGIRTGDAVDIRVIGPEVNQTVNLEGEVRWAEPDLREGAELRVGVRLTNLSLADYNQWVNLLYSYLDE